MSVQDHVSSSMNDSGTSEKIDTPLTQPGSPNVLVKRNLAEQSKWLNDETGERPWATHETQQVSWAMGKQVEVLTRGERAWPR